MILIFTKDSFRSFDWILSSQSLPTGSYVVACYSMQGDSIIAGDISSCYREKIEAIGASAVAMMNMWEQG